MRRARFTISILACALTGCADSIHNIVAKGELDSLRARLQSDPGACNDRNREGKTAVHYAVNFAQREAFLVLVESGGCDINAADRTGLTPLHSAAFIGLPAAVPMLLEAGANLEARDEFGDTPLHTAAMKGRVDMVQALIEAGADVTARNNAGRTPKDQAEYYGMPEAAAMLTRAQE